MVKIKAEINVKPILRMLSRIGKDVELKVAPRAMNRAMVTVKKVAVNEARKVINLPVAGSSKGGEGKSPPGLRSLINTTTASAGSLVAELKATRKPISLIHFVVGSKEPASQKDLFLKHRKRVNVKVVPGLKWRLGKSFIAKANGAVQVFVRQTTKSLPITKRGVVGLFNFLNNDMIVHRLQVIARARFMTELHRDFKYYVSKLDKRLTK